MSLAQFLKGLVIILIGVILLLNNFNILSWSVWINILRLWPILLISLGLSLIFRKRLSWLAPLIILIGIIIGASTNYMGIDLKLEGKIATEVETLQKELTLVPDVRETEPETKVEIEISPEEEVITESDTEAEEEKKEIAEIIPPKEIEMVPNIQKANLKLNYEVGTFTLQYPTPLLYQCQVSYRYPEFKPKEDYSLLDKEANIQIYHNPISEQRLQNPNNRIELRLNKDIIYNILIETGATAIDYDLSKFKIENFSIKSGASKINITVPQYNGEINIDSGVSKIDIAIPLNVGTRIYFETGLSIKDLGEDFQKLENNIYISKNYHEAEYRVNINIDSGLSQINIYYL